MILNATFQMHIRYLLKHTAILQSEEEFSGENSLKALGKTKNYDLVFALFLGKEKWRKSFA